jgi:hypothetical protein
MKIDLFDLMIEFNGQNERVRILPKTNIDLNKVESQTNIELLVEKAVIVGIESGVEI